MEDQKESHSIPRNQLNLMVKMASKILDMMANAPSYIKSYDDMTVVLGMVQNLINGAGKEEK